MELLAAFFWLLVLIADIAFMRQIKRLADALFPIEKKRTKKAPGGAATPTKGRTKMTDIVYQITKENAR